MDPASGRARLRIGCVLPQNLSALEKQQNDGRPTRAQKRTVPMSIGTVLYRNNPFQRGFDHWCSLGEVFLFLPIAVEHMECFPFSFFSFSLTLRRVVSFSSLLNS